MKSEKKIFSEVIGILEKLNIPYMIGGSVASIYYGEPRMTLDMDVVIQLKPEQAKKFSASFGDEYYADLEQMLNAIDVQGHFNIIQSEAGVKVDFYVLKNDAFSQSGFTRKKKESFSEERSAYFASPEDTILKKLEWHKMGGSQKHLEDIRGMLKVSGDVLDKKYIDKWSLKLGVNDVWKKLFGEFNQ
ncbi:MAG: hypothetical protein KKH83_07250 [Candidatus Margulisbacteria bacterium]|nr:hypothetical protein [Candidatus Margulisiibacteriota bacterium]